MLEHIVNTPIYPCQAHSNESIVYLIDDDERACAAMTRLMQSIGIQVIAFSDPQSFFSADLRETPACLVMELRLKAASGLAIQKRLRAEGIQIPVIFATNHGDVATSVMAMKAGAVDFLAKPFREQEMIDAVTHALAIDRKRLATGQHRIQIVSLYNSLTPRERDVVQLVVRGKRCKQMAAELGIAEITVKIHKRNAMGKLGAKSLAEFVIKANAIGLCDTESDDSAAYRMPSRMGRPSSFNALSQSSR